jgi:hypothetical protein
MPTIAGWHVPPQLMSINTISSVLAYISVTEVTESIHWGLIVTLSSSFQEQHDCYGTTTIKQFKTRNPFFI